MAYKRSYSRRYRKRYYSKKSKISVAKLYKMIKKNKPEVKVRNLLYTDLSLSSFGYGSSAIVQGLATNIAQGTNDGYRIGNKIRLIGIKVDLAFAPGDNTNYMRLIIFRPKSEVQSTGGTLVQNVLSNNASSGTQWLTPVDSDRYKTYLDKRSFMRYGPVDGSTATSIVSKMTFVRKFIKCNIPIQWDVSGNILRDLYILAISDSAAIPHAGAVAGNVKLYYTDA